MTRIAVIALILISLFGWYVMAQSKQKATRPEGLQSAPTWRPLSQEEARIVIRKGTERPFTGQWLKNKKEGTYTCTRCAAPLFASQSKFDSGTGWPSFDATLQSGVLEVRDADGMRTEIQCGRCGGHLGHVFRGEGMTKKNTRHCVNSLSLGFVEGRLEEAFFAGGCFWGVEHLLEGTPGVLRADSGYMGGQKDAPSYQEVCGKKTGHAEAVRVLFDPAKVSYKELAKLFFEIHDPTQIDRQGPDRGNQYRSAVFVTGEAQAKATQELIALLEAKGLKVATQVAPAGKFWPAEAYHQDYYKRTGKAPYCHARTPRFE